MARVRFGTSSAFLVAYLVAVVLGRQVILPGTGLALFWPAAGVAALWLVRGHGRRQIALDGTLVVLTTVLSNLVLSVPFWSAVAFGLANLVVGLGARAVWAYAATVPFHGLVRPPFAAPRDLFVVGLASLVGALVSMPFGLVGSRIYAGSWSETVAVAWVVRNACGAFVVVSYVLAVRDSHRQRLDKGLGFVQTFSSRRRPTAGIELAATSVITLGTGLAVFASRGQEPIAFLMVAAAAWIGFRFAPVVGASYTVVFAVIAVICTENALGPFGDVEDPSTRALIVQSYLAIIGAIAMMLALGTSERLSLTRRAQASEADARDQADLLRAVTDVMQDGVIVIDRDGHVLVSNPASQELVPGMRPGSLRRAGSYGVFHLDGSEIEESERPHRAALAGRTVDPQDLLAIDPKTGEHRILSMRGVPLPRVDVPGEHMAVLLLRDVTRERAEIRELQAFAGVVAHDLKNPLASVMSWAEILDDQLDDLEVDASAPRSSLVKIYRTSDKMQQLIADLLTFTRARSAEIESTSISLDALVDEVVGDVVEHTRGPSPRIERGTLGHVSADVTLVRQVFANLLGNAVKYVAEDTVPAVRISALRRGELVEVRIADNGLGIPRSEQGKVFDSFYRSSVTHDLPGTGLGLAICARAIERHGGTIAARSGDDGRGTVMVFTLPVDPLADPDELEEGQREEGLTTSAEPPPRRTGSETAVS